MMDSDRRSLAERIRCLISGTDGGSPEAVAVCLGVDEPSLRLAIDDSAPRASLDLLLAIIDHYGVDPAWLITGEYCSGTHAEALECAGDRRRNHVLRDLVRRLASPDPLRDDLGLWHDEAAPLR
jgi:hypothetical protein